MSESGEAGGQRGEIVALEIVVVIFLALRLYFDVAAGLFGDEAYYWLWGQHPALSYFDHPPLHAWLLWAVDRLAGWHVWSVRLLTWLTLAGVLALFHSLARRLAPAAPRLWFWRTAAIYLASPMFFGMTAFAYNDHLLVFTSLLATVCFLNFVDSAETGTGHPRRWLYLAALALGLAMLSKYNAVFVGLGFAATLGLRPQLRPWLRTPHPWLAALLAAAMQAPVIWWNLDNGFASLRYHLDDRWGSALGTLHWLHPAWFVLVSLVFWSPLLAWPLVRLIRTAPAGAFEARARTLMLSIFSISTLCLLAISPVLDAYFYWNIVAFAGLMPLLTRFMANRLLLWAHLGFGPICAGLLVFNCAVTPLGDSNDGSAINYGWDEIAAHVNAVQAADAADLVGATRYSTTAQLGFALGTTAVTKLSGEHSEWDYWQSGEALAGKSALVLVDKSTELPWLKAHFATLRQVDSFAITRYGRVLYKWRLFRGEGFVP